MQKSGGEKIDHSCRWMGKCKPFGHYEWTTYEYTEDVLTGNSEISDANKSVEANFADDMNESTIMQYSSSSTPFEISGNNTCNNCYNNTGIGIGGKVELKHNIEWRWHNSSLSDDNTWNNWGELCGVKDGPGNSSAAPNSDTIAVPLQSISNIFNCTCDTGRIVNHKFFKQDPLNNNDANLTIELTLEDQEYKPGELINYRIRNTGFNEDYYLLARIDEKQEGTSKYDIEWWCPSYNLVKNAGLNSIVESYTNNGVDISGAWIKKIGAIPSDMSRIGINTVKDIHYLKLVKDYFITYADEITNKIKTYYGKNGEAWKTPISTTKWEQTVGNYTQAQLNAIENRPNLAKCGIDEGEHGFIGECGNQGETRGLRIKDCQDKCDIDTTCGSFEFDNNTNTGIMYDTFTPIYYKYRDFDTHENDIRDKKCGPNTVDVYVAQNKGFN